MEECKAIIRTYVSKGMKVETAVYMAGMSKSKYYYRSRPGKGGRKPSTHTFQKQGQIVPNEEVVNVIRSILSEEFMENGYRKVMNELKDRGYQIGKTKTYRLMKSNRLLLARKRKGLRQYVRFTQPLPLEPLEKLEMDIKYIYIRGERRNALLLNILDTFTRHELGWELQYSIGHETVRKLFHQVIEHWLQTYRPPYDDQVSVTIRCDNDSRFIAHDLQDFLKNNFISQEFIIPATPEQNAHIESFHSVVEQLVCSKYEFESIHHARNVFSRFFETYNNRRTISSLIYLPPAILLKEWYGRKIGLKMRKIKGRVKQTFFFRGQRPKWLSAPPEDLFNLGNHKNTNENTNFVKPILI